MKRPATSPLAPTSPGKDTCLLSKALRDLSGASNLKDERVGHYLATWALSCPLARRQFNNAVHYVNSGNSTHPTGEACKATVEAYAASFLPPTAMCELILNMRAPKSSWRTLSELYTLRKLEYHRTVPGGPYSRPICPGWDFKPVGRSWSPRCNWMTPLPRCCPGPAGCHGPSPHGSHTSCPLARRQFNNAVQYVNSATSTHTTGEACKAAVEAYAASLLPRTAMCELVLNMGPQVLVEDLLGALHAP